jgi:putative DNA-invertase from lambdoid prophage Rac
MAIHAYLRTSTDQQDLETQRLEIETYAKSKNIEIDDWIEVEISSRKKKRDRRINELINGLRKGDTLVVSELSRLARSMRETHNIIHDIAKKKVEVHIIKQNLITKSDNDMATKIYINSFAMAAEIERELISQRTKNGIALARKRGKQIGNPNLKADNRKRIAKANEFAESLKGIISGLINNGLTQRQIVDELNKSGVKTARGCEWKLITLQRVLKRLDLSTVR